MHYSARLRIRTILIFLFWTKAPLTCFLIPWWWPLHPSPFFDLISPHSQFFLLGLQPHEPPLDPTDTPTSFASKYLGTHFLFLAHSLCTAVFHPFSQLEKPSMRSDVTSLQKLSLTTLVKWFHHLHPVTLWYSTFLLPKGSFWRLGTLCCDPYFL